MLRVSHLFLFYKLIVPIIFCVLAPPGCIKKHIFLCIQQKAGSHVLRAEQEVEEEDVEGEDEEEEEDVEEEGDIGDRGHLFTSQHACPLVQHKVNEYP